MHKFLNSNRFQVLRVILKLLNERHLKIQDFKFK
jgi:hypothetical protein